MYVSISKASEMTGAARSTIYKDIEDGTLSYELNARNKKEINVSELARVYGLKDTTEMSSNVVSVVERSESPAARHSDQVAVLQERIEAQKIRVSSYEETLEMIKEERERERKQYQAQLESLEKALEKAQEGQNKLTLLLEHKESTGAGEWQMALKAIEERVANQETAAKEEQERAQKILRQNQALKKALEEEKNKSFWQKLFG